jgi:curved DNA-binding protein CbpA
MASEISLSGRLRDTKLPTLLRFLQRNKKTGILNFHRNDLDKSIYIKNGDIVFAVSKYPDDRLGEVLLKMGRITLEQYETSVQLLKQTKKRQGTILVEQGFITPKDLFAAVVHQVKEIIMSLFTWIEGDYLFQEGDLPSEEVITLRMSTARLIYEGVHRNHDWTRLRRELPPLNTTLQITIDPLVLFQDVGLEPPSQQLISLIDGTKTVEEIFKRSKLTAFETLKCLYFLIAVGIVEARTAEVPVEEPAAEAVELKSEEPAPALKEQPSPPPPGPAPISLEEEIQVEVQEEKREDVEKSRIELFQEKEEAGEYNVQKIRDAYAAMKNQDHYEVLGVGRNAPKEEIKKAYFLLAKAYHPDRHFQAGMQEVKEQLEELFQRITEAYDTLLMERKRKEYDIALVMSKFEKKRGPAVSGDTDEARAEQQFQRGQEAIKRGDFREAVHSLQWCVRLNSKQAKYYAALGRALARIPRRMHDAEQSFLKAIELEPSQPQHHIILGLLYKEGKLTQRAIKKFEDALMWDPDNKQAKAELQNLKAK